MTHRLREARSSLAPHRADHLAALGGSIVFPPRMRRSARREEMLMSSRFALVVGALLASLAAQSLSAQQAGSSGALRNTAGAKPQTSHATSSDSALVELGRAISVLATTVQTVVEETAKNPE